MTQYQLVGDPAVFAAAADEIADRLAAAATAMIISAGKTYVATLGDELVGLAALVPHFFLHLLQRR